MARNHERRNPPHAGRRVVVGWVIVASMALGTTALPAAPVDDLSVGWIERRPRLPYVWDAEDPTVTGWPVPGDTVSWVAHVRNLGDRDLTRVSYRWLLDGDVVREGRATLRAGRVKKFRLRQTWDRRRRELAFEVDPSAEVVEIEERNNRVLIHTDALAVGFWVERTFWDRIREVVTRADIGATTFEDWMQRRVRQYNEMAALARYPDTPDGVIDRWRVDKIKVVGDAGLPVSPVGPEVPDAGVVPGTEGIFYPDSRDRTVDMQWGFPTDRFFVYENADSESLLYGSLVHELGHARYLADVYAWNVTTDDVIGIEPAPPSDRGTYYVTSEHGLMNQSYGFIDRYSAVALNLIAGHRATQGHYNEPVNLGAFLNDLPRVNRLRLVAPDGRALQNRRVRIYRASAAVDPDISSGVYKLMIDGNADEELQTDGNGVVNLGRNPFSAGDLVLKVDRNNTLAVIEVIDGSNSLWGYLESRLFNLAAWRGDADTADHELVVGAPICFGPGSLPGLVSPAPEALVTRSNVTFRWPMNHLRPENLALWYSVDGSDPVRRSVSVSDGADTAVARARLRGARVNWWIEFKRSISPPECPTLRSNIYSFDLASRR